MANAPQWQPQFDGVFQWGSFGSPTSGTGSGNTRRRRWSVIDTAVDTVFVWNSFGATVTPTPTGQVDTAKPQGRAEWLGFDSRPRSREERTLHLRKERERFGIIEEASKVIARVAARQAQALESDNQKRFEELERELALNGIPWKGGYLELLNEARRRIIDAEIKEHLQALQFIEEEIMLLLLVSVL